MSLPPRRAVVMVRAFVRRPPLGSWTILRLWMKATLLFRCGVVLAHDRIPAVHGVGAGSHPLPGVSAMVETGAMAII